MSAPSSAPSPSPTERKPAKPRSRGAWTGVLGRVIAWALGLAAAGLVSGVLLVGIAVAVAYPNVPEISGLMDYRPKLPMRIYAADGVLLGEFGEERRTFTPIAQIPKVMKDAVLAAEDSRFYEHGGVDYRGIVRAALANLHDARSQGGSTITMQVAQQLLPVHREDLHAQDLRAAADAEDREPLEQGADSRAVHEPDLPGPARLRLRRRQRGLFRQAAQGHHGRRGGDAGRPAAARRRPTTRSPTRSGRRCCSTPSSTACWRTDYITEAQHDAARAQVLNYRAPAAVPTHAEYAVESARQLVYAQYGDDAYSRGLDVFLTIRTRRPGSGLPRVEARAAEFRAAAGLSRARGLCRPARQSRAAGHAHCRSTGRAPRQRRPARGRGAGGLAPEGGGGAADPATASPSPAPD